MLRRTISLDAGYKLSVHTTLGRLLNVLCMCNLHSLSREKYPYIQSICSNILTRQNLVFSCILQSVKTLLLAHLRIHFRNNYVILSCKYIRYSTLKEITYLLKGRKFFLSKYKSPKIIERSQR